VNSQIIPFLTIRLFFIGSTPCSRSGPRANGRVCHQQRETNREEERGQDGPI
jgi:hypothetical protein